MPFNAKITLKYDSTWTYDDMEEFLPEEHITMEFPAQDLSSHQVFEGFRKFLLSTGYDPKSIAKGGARVAFNEYRTEQEMRETAEEFDLVLIEDYNKKVKELEQKIMDLKAKLSRLQNPDNPNYTDEEMDAMCSHASDRQITKQTLVDAYKVCHDCGTKYGSYSAGCSSRWIERCDVCGEIKAVTEARDYNYLREGIEDLSK